MPIEGIRQLQYRGNFALKRRKDYTGAILSVRYTGGYREDVTIAQPLRGWSLTYSALTNTLVPLTDAEPVDRLTYIWDFYCASKDNSNAPFIVADLDNKLYLCVFTEQLIETSHVDYKLATTGLQLEQVYVKGVNTNADGSIESGDNPDRI